MAKAIKLNENQFRFKKSSSVDKEKTYARIDKDTDGGMYFTTRFEIMMKDKTERSDDEKSYYRIPLTTNKTILRDNAYTTGLFKITEIDGNTSELKIILQIASKQPGGGED